MNYIVKEVSFERENFVSFESDETWEFSTRSVRTPKGDFMIDDVHLVDNDQFVGVELSIWMSNFQLNQYKDESSSNEMPQITTLAFVRHPHNAWLWAYLIDEIGHTIATFCGYESNIDDFRKYNEELMCVDYSTMAHFKAEKYMIIEMKEDCLHNKFGNVYLVKANPIKTNPNMNKVFHGTYVPYCDQDTEDFLFNDKDFVDNLLILAQSYKPWTPNPDYFEDEMCRNQYGERKRVHLHKSLTDPDYDDDDFRLSEESPTDLMARLIPNLLLKENSLVNQWQFGGYCSYPELNDYVRSLANNDVKDFFVWLFDDQRFHGCKVWELPEEYNCAYENFLNFISLQEED